MEYERDPAKAASNRQKHTVSFADAIAVFSDPFALTIADAFSSEERFIIIGMDAFGAILVVVYTWRDADTICIISARKATRQERKIYTG